MDNQQLQDLNMNNNEKQIILSGLLGDGYISIPLKSNKSRYTTTSYYEEYIDFKINLLKNIRSNKRFVKSQGIAKTPIYILDTNYTEEIALFKSFTLDKILHNLDELGIAMWFYDDGSLHKDKLFYNLCTHAFTKEEQEEYFIPFFNKFNIFPKLTIERKKDGREFYYLRISKFEGAYEIATILTKFPIECYKYKIWSSETIQKWSKLQEKLKSENISNISNKMKGVLLDKIEI
jgi:hypothetical protein